MNADSPEFKAVVLKLEPGDILALVVRTHATSEVLDRFQLAVNDKMKEWGKDIHAVAFSGEIDLSIIRGPALSRGDIPL